MNNILKVFEKDTSVTATNRVFLFQYLHTLNGLIYIVLMIDKLRYYANLKMIFTAKKENHFTSSKLNAIRVN
ncbi:hypothetical protein [Clostridium scatologenes]|uniref:hypothetical protein n=1 Tax=Clostridium scatologenes TaxID=1548 RepID=UPI00048FAB93|nr:hypothetical protein [Clostridium scatologenes]